VSLAAEVRHELDTEVERHQATLSFLDTCVELLGKSCRLPSTTCP
jgi:hypothetical protein